jgi:peptidoglycan/LPS O-acetylase OafA/YrhL
MKLHFRNLDTFRAIAALIVVIHHIELFKLWRDIPDIDNYIPSGHIAVVLFFVLSGFLITYLLIKEKESHENISFKKFYLRRIFRNCFEFQK